MDQDDNDRSYPEEELASALTIDLQEPAAASVEELSATPTLRGWPGTILMLLCTVLALFRGVEIDYILRGRSAQPKQPSDRGAAAIAPASVGKVEKLAGPVQGPAIMPTPSVSAVHLPGSYKLPVAYGQLGPELIKAGAFDLAGFVEVFDRSGHPLNGGQMAVLKDGSDALITIDNNNAHFLLNFFWAVGLANRNPILLEGPIQEQSGGQIEKFASTGGWILATRPITEVFASLPLITLTAVQQQRLEEVASAVYRPCCGNDTAFPDCNHGMAMLGLLELMAAQNATVDEMFEAAKYVNAFWFPQQSAEVAMYFNATQNLEFAAVEPREIVGRAMFSASGFASVHQWLANKGRLGQPAGGGNSCGV